MFSLKSPTIQTHFENHIFSQKFAFLGSYFDKLNNNFSGKKFVLGNQVRKG